MQQDLLLPRYLTPLVFLGVVWLSWYEENVLSVVAEQEQRLLLVSLYSLADAELFVVEALDAFFALSLVGVDCRTPIDSV